MKKRAKTVTLVASVVFLTGVLTFLQLYGKAHRHVLTQAVVKESAAPYKAFALWRELGIKGRILVLLDRRLNAEEEDHEFVPDEFEGAFAIQGLCNAVKQDMAGEDETGFYCSVKGLNSLLSTADLYTNLYLHKKTALSDEMTTLAGHALGQGRASGLAPKEKNQALILLNRRVLGELYPALCPKEAPGQVTPRNYVYRAIQAGMVRKVYHVISDSVWEEVSAVLDKYPLVTGTHGIYRMTIVEGTPVSILRMRDLQSLGETVVVNVNTDAFRADELTEIMSGLRNRMHADLVTASGEKAHKVVSLYE